MLGLNTSLTQDYQHVFIDDYSLQFDGADDYVDCDAVVNITDFQEITGAGSISLWVKIGLTSSSGNIIRMETDTSNYISIMYHNGTQQTRAVYRGSGSSTTARISDVLEEDGVWHHIVSTWSTTSNKLRIYLDGSLAQERPSSGSLDTFVGDIANIDIGQNTNGGSYFKGHVNDLCIFGKELTAANVTSIYNNGIPSDLLHIPGIKDEYMYAYYKFEKGTGTVLVDHSGNKKNGTLNNSPTWSTDVP